jgi:hypothetical protein
MTMPFDLNDSRCGGGKHDPMGRTLRGHTPASTATPAPQQAPQHRRHAECCPCFRRHRSHQIQSKLGHTPALPTRPAYSR